ncbi:MAG: cold-shock protein [Thermodesulfobacteriota bacterium]
MKENGTVKWFNTRKGFGFIELESGKDAFVHYSDIEDQEGRKNLRQGQEVLVNVVHATKGLKAVNVQAL